MKITFLGTSSAVPTETRNHNSILLSYNAENILVDCGEGTQRQIRRAKLSPCAITRLLITHFHGDHTFGIPGLLQTLALNKYDKKLLIYGPKGTKKFIEKIFEAFVFALRINYEVKEVSGKFINTEDFEISAFSLDHDTPTNGYTFKEKDKLRIDKDKLEKLKIGNIPELGELIKGKNVKVNGKLLKFKELTYKQKGKKIAFVMDTRMCKSILGNIKDCDFFIVESTFLESSEEGRKKASEYGHLTSRDAGKLAKKGKVKKLFLTHISQRYEYTPNVLIEDAKKEFSGEIVVPNDLEVFPLK